MEDFDRLIATWHQTGRVEDLLGMVAAFDITVMRRALRALHARERRAAVGDLRAMARALALYVEEALGAQEEQAQRLFLGRASQKACLAYSRSARGAVRKQKEK